MCWVSHQRHVSEVAGDGWRGGDFDFAKERLADVDRQPILVGLETIGARDPAAFGLGFDNRHAGNAAQQVSRRAADAMRAELAWCVIGERWRLDSRLWWLEVGAQPAGSVKPLEEFEKVIGSAGDQVGIFAGQAEDAAVLVFDCQRAARRCADDDVALAHVWRQLGQVGAGIAASGVKFAIGLHGQAAAVLLGHRHLAAVVRQHFYRSQADVRLVIVGAAPMKIDHLGTVGGGRGRARKARAEAGPREAREGRMPADAEHALGQAAKQAIVDRKVGQRREGRAELPQELAAAEQPAAQWKAIALGQPRFGDDVHLGDLNAVRADARAYTAHRAIVYRAVH